MPQPCTRMLHPEESYFNISNLEAATFCNTNSRFILVTNCFSSCSKSWRFNWWTNIQINSNFQINCLRGFDMVWWYCIKSQISEEDRLNKSKLAHVYNSFSLGSLNQPQRWVIYVMLQTCNLNCAMIHDTRILHLLPHLIEIH